MALSSHLFHAMIFLALVLPFISTSSLAQGPNPVSPDVVTADELVVDLGSPKFTVRERAQRQLLEIGSPALPAIETGLASDDIEVRTRCTNLSLQITARSQLGLLAAFRAGDSSQLDKLPGYRDFEKVGRVEPLSRALFAKMLEREWPILAAWHEQNWNKCRDLIAGSVVDLQSATQFGERKGAIGTLATLLLVGGDDRVTLSEESTTALFALCYQMDKLPPVDTPLTITSSFRGIVGRWIQSSKNSRTSYQSLSLALRLNLPEGLVPAERVLASSDQPAYVRQFAVLAIAKFGDRSHLSLVETLLDDTSVCSRRENPERNEVFESQVRDMALAALLQLTGLSTKDYGFVELQRNPLYVFVPNTVGFASDEQRSAAIARWHTYRLQDSDRLRDGEAFREAEASAP